MKKVILSEEQIKRLVDKLIINEQDTSNSQPTNQTESEYTMYYIGLKRYVVKDNGGSYQLFTLVNDGNGDNKYKIGEELSTELTFNVLNNRLPDIIQNLRDTGGKSQVRGSSGSIYMSKNDDQLFNDVQQYGDDLNPLKNKKGDVVYKKVQVEFQRITDQNTENSLEEGLNNLQPIMQSAKIPGSLTEGIRVVTLGMSRLNKNVPVLGTLFVMVTDDLPERRPLEVLPSREGNKLILNKTAIKQRDRTYIWLRFIGQMFGDGGYPWDPNTGLAIIPKTTPNTTPKPIPPPPVTPPPSVNFTVDFGNNFESGKFELDTNYQKNIDDKVTQIVNFIKGKQLKKFKLVITPGESLVPNQAPYKEPGSLARKRGEILKGYLSIALKNLLSMDPPIEVAEPVIGTTKWDPKLGKDYDAYKKEQFVRVSVVITA